MLWHSTDIDAVLKHLEADPARGMSQAEAARRLAQHGANELVKEERASPITLFFAQFKNTLIIILLVATILSAFWERSSTRSSYSPSYCSVLCLASFRSTAPSGPLMR